ncbi:ead/Ea22-like family protein [Enterobacter hormaechei]|uniref:ead/Ea22-like family protein n=1 Tax=Enterobacter hormaechei TaxID=158836 RepID=UPI00193E3D12|nr:ead/Ea22-like family protein [Enterobacter hormaechei]
MSNIDKRALREAAEKALSAGDGNWHTWREAGMNYPEIFTSSGHIVATVNGSFAVVRSDFIAAANPATVLALLDELEAKDKSISFLKDQLAQLANFNPDWDKLEAATYSLREHMAELTAARKRIAELEAREVLLPQRYSMLHRVDFDEPYHTEMVYKQHQVLEALHDAGVNVAAAAKGE